MPWLILIIAGCFEVLWALGLKSSEGFTRLGPSVFTVITLFLSLFLLSVALRNIPIGTAYAAWTSIGALGTAIAGVMLYNEPIGFVKVACLLMILGGVAGLRLIS
ncbi:MAG: QacE family quaternary ammonium compound efflux SMR transporter [Candidatus Riflebacteria bacterium HGW-Riflebacteria-1]|nr:MAG: QacE family quaternary ammonium compound efflux SMR transporter [Candidatus Riflebacteria bacterium HGW-Riflebacteria-1]